MISNMRSQLDIVSSGTTAKEAVDKWMGRPSSENVEEADCLELVMVDTNGI
jgi:hypothetical protein